jgi:hypothetical protein
MYFFIATCVIKRVKKLLFFDWTIQIQL